MDMGFYQVMGGLDGGAGEGKGVCESCHRVVGRVSKVGRCMLNSCGFWFEWSMQD